VSLPETDDGSANLGDQAVVMQWWIEGLLCLWVHHPGQHALSENITLCFVEHRLGLRRRLVQRHADSVYATHCANRVTHDDSTDEYVQHIILYLIGTVQLLVQRLIYLRSCLALSWSACV